MAEPRNIFELINQNIVDLSKDVVDLYAKVEEIHNALFPQVSEPDTPGAEVKSVGQ